MCIRDRGRTAPKGGVTPGMLKKAYTKAGLPMPEFNGTFMRAKVVPQDAIDDAIEAGVDEAQLEGNTRLNEESCYNSRDDMLAAYTRFGQATTKMGKVRRLKFPLIQCRYDPLKATGRTSSSQGDDPKPGEAWVAWGEQIQNQERTGDEE